MNELSIEKQMDFRATSRHVRVWRSRMRAVSLGFGIALVVTLAVVWTPPRAGAETLTPVRILTENESGVRLSRAQTSLFPGDGENPFHLVYYTLGQYADSGGELFYRYAQRSPGATPTWSEPVIVTQSPRQARHPSIVVTRDRTRVVAWHDNRHATKEGNYIDNVEIYLSTGVSSSEDEAPHFGPDRRVTNTSAGHMGDSGFLPTLLERDGGLHGIFWHDFAFDADISDLFFANVELGALDDALPVDMAATRLTDAVSRGGKPPYVTPKGVLLGDGTMYVIFSTGFSDLSGDLSIIRIDPDGLISPAQTLATNASSYFAPPQVAVDPDDRVWMLWVDRARGPDVRQVVLGRLTLDATALDRRIVVTPEEGDFTNPDFAIGSDGTLYIVWEEIVSLGYYDTASIIHYATLDPETGERSDVLDLTDDETVSERPTIAAGENGWVCVVWERTSEENPYTPQIASILIGYDSPVMDWELH